MLEGVAVDLLTGREVNASQAVARCKGGITQGLTVWKTGYRQACTTYKRLRGDFKAHREANVLEFRARAERILPNRLAHGKAGRRKAAAQVKARFPYGLTVCQLYLRKTGALRKSIAADAKNGRVRIRSQQGTIHDLLLMALRSARADGEDRSGHLGRGKGALYAELDAERVSNRFKIRLRHHDSGHLYHLPISSSWCLHPRWN